MVLLLAGLCATAVFADGDMPIGEHQLPEAAQRFVKAYFGDVRIARAEKDAGVAPSYEVRFADGSKVEFDARGRWTDVESPRRMVPADLIPGRIADFLDVNYPGANVKGIEREGRGYKVELANGDDLHFDRRHRMVGCDD